MADEPACRGRLGSSSGTLPTRIEATVAIRLNKKMKKQGLCGSGPASYPQYPQTPGQKHARDEPNLSRRAVYRVLALLPPWQRGFVSMIAQLWQQQVFPLLGPSIYECQLLSRDAAS